MLATPPPYILLIEDDEKRRIEVCTICCAAGTGSCRAALPDEAQEKTRHLTYGMTLHELVIVGERAEREGGTCIRRGFEEHFPRLGWITYPLDRDIVWLGELLGSLRISSLFHSFD